MLQESCFLLKSIADNKPKINAFIATTLIEKIIIHQDIEDDFGFRQQEIEIIFRFVGKID